MYHVKGFRLQGILLPDNISKPFAENAIWIIPLLKPGKLVSTHIAVTANRKTLENVGSQIRGLSQHEVELQTRSRASPRFFQPVPSSNLREVNVQSQSKHNKKCANAIDNQQCDKTNPLDKIMNKNVQLLSHS